MAEQASKQVDLPQVHRCPEWTVGLSDESKMVCERWQTGAPAYDAGSPAQRARRGKVDWPVAWCALTWALAEEVQGSTPSEASCKQASPPWGSDGEQVSCCPAEGATTLLAAADVAEDGTGRCACSSLPLGRVQ